MRKCTPFTTIADVLQKETRHYLKKFKIEGIIEPHDGMVYDYSIMVTFWLLSGYSIMVTFWSLLPSPSVGQIGLDTQLLATC